jgi:CBS domain containing-hemolysin-like protein
MIWLAIGVGLLVTVFGASASAALVVVSRMSLAEAVSRRLRGQPSSLEWLDEAERELAGATATTGLGTAILAAGLSAGVAVVTGALPLWGILLLVLLGAIPLVLFSGYVLPRWLTVSRATRVAGALRPILRPWSRALALVLPEPARRKENDALPLWREAAGVLAPTDELVMVGNVITFAQHAVREVMTPRTDLVAIPEEAGPDEITQAFLQSGYSRIPVYRGTIDEILGMVHVFDLLKLKPGQRVPVRPVGVAPASRSCGDVLLDMQRERRHLTVVLDEFGGTAGIVTLEDLLEAMVGEIYDEHDLPPGGLPPDVVHPVWEAEGATEVHELEERFGVTLPGTARTIGGRLLEHVGRVPREGERFVLGGLELDVLAVSQTRIDRLVVRRAGAPVYPLDRGDE